MKTKTNINIDRPDKILINLVSKIPKEFVLDIGAGKGRNSLFLAKKGFVVESIDKSLKAIKHLKEISQKEKIKNLRPKKINVLKFNFRASKYILIIACYSLDFLKKSETHFVIKKIKRGLHKNGLVFLSVFSVKEKSYRLAKKLGFKEIEQRTFYFPKLKGYRNFFTKTELKKYFSDFKILYLRQKQVKDYHDGLHHSHNIIQIVAKKV